MDPTRLAELSVAVVIPAHNEAAHVGGVVRSVPDWVRRVIVVDDASMDGTVAAVEAVGDDRVRLLRHDTNVGVGGAMRTGYRAALAEGFGFVAKMDADGQMRGEELERLLEPLARGCAEYTKGNRFYFRKATADMPFERAFGNTLLSFMTKLASGYWHVFDSQCGFTAIRAAYLRLLDLDALPNDYFFENDMLIRLNALNARVVDVPVATVYGQEVSGVSIGRVIRTFPPRLIADGTLRFWRKHLVTDFSPIGALTLGGMLMFAFGFVFGAYHWYASVATGTPATTGTVMVAVLPVILGIQLLVQSFALSVSASPGARETADFIRELIAREKLG